MNHALPVDAVLSDLAREADPAERLWLMLELTGPRPPEWDRVRLFQVTGDLLPELRALVDSGRFIRTDADRDSPAARARAMLAWWNDPQDAGRIGPPDADRRATPALAAADPWALCSAFTEHHFDAEGFKDPTTRTWNACTSVDLSRDGSRALISFEVRYAHWGYQIRLSAIQEPGAPEAARWRLYDARMSGREHFL